RRRLEAEFAGREARTPSDSAVRRLFPAASEDPDLADEYRRLAQQDLADGKLADLRRVMRILDRTGSGHSEVVIDDDESMALLRALNDVGSCWPTGWGSSATATSTPCGCSSRSGNRSRAPSLPVTTTTSAPTSSSPSTSCCPGCRRACCARWTSSARRQQRALRPARDVTEL